MSGLTRTYRSSGEIPRVPTGLRGASINGFCRRVCDISAELGVYRFHLDDRGPVSLEYLQRYVIKQGQRIECDEDGNIAVLS